MAARRAGSVASEAVLVSDPRPPEQTEVQTADFDEAVDNLRSAFGVVDMRRAEQHPSRFACAPSACRR